MLKIYDIRGVQIDIAAILHTHGQPEVTLDTLESIHHYLTDQTLVVVDGAGWDHFKSLKMPSKILKGFYHGYFRAPYRNVILSLMHAAKTWPNSDWYAYLEFDCLIGSSVIKKDFELADEHNIWLIGNDYRAKQTVRFPLVEMMLKEKFEEIVYLLGAVLFYSKKFIHKLLEVDFFERFLWLTNEFRDGFFPGYEGPAAWDLAEHMMPTLAKHWGGNVTQFAKWNQHIAQWVGGNYRRYPIRWRPDLDVTEEVHFQSAIMHPLKELNNPIRVFHREKRHRNDIS